MIAGAKNKVSQKTQVEEIKQSQFEALDEEIKGALSNMGSDDEVPVMNVDCKKNLNLDPENSSEDKGSKFPGAADSDDQEEILKDAQKFRNLRSSVPASQAMSTKSNPKRTPKALMKEINQKKKNYVWEKDVFYETIGETQFVFEQLLVQDFMMDPEHDEFVKKASKKYSFMAIGKMNVKERLKFSEGILDEKSAKKNLGDLMNRKFVVVRECPTFEGNQQQWQNLVINIAIPTDTFQGTVYKLIPMRVCSVIDILPYEARVAIMSYIADECATRRNKLSKVKLPAKYARYNVMAGADLADATQEDLENMRANDMTIKGWLYGRKTWRLEYAPEKLTEATFFFENESALNTDCLVHAVNYALRYPFFVSREQVVRLMALRGKMSLESVTNKKSLSGVSPTIFQDFCVIDGKSLSLHLLETFKVEEGQGANKLRAFITEMMLETQEFSELVVVGSAQGALVAFSHACTFVAIDQNSKRHLAYLDCQGKDAEWYPTVPTAQTGPLLNFNDEFDKFWEMKVFALKRAVVNPERALKINQQMQFVMTGNKDYVGESQSEAAKKMLKKRKSKGW